MTAEDKKTTIFVTEKMVHELNDKMFEFTVYAQREAIAKTVKMAVEIIERNVERHTPEDTIMDLQSELTPERVMGER